MGTVADIGARYRDTGARHWCCPGAGLLPCQTPVLPVPGTRAACRLATRVDSSRFQTMARPLRFIPPGSVVEVTSRTVGSRFLLRPGPAANSLIVGVLGRAQSLFGVRVFAVAVMSNHIHALLGVDHAAHLATFMQYALGNIAKELARHHKWKGPFWGRRYRSIVVADDASQVARLRYVLCQGIKERLIARAAQWPGVSSFATLARGMPMRGIWRSRTDEERSKEKEYELKHTRLPALSHKTEDDHKAYVETIVRAEEDEAQAERRRAASKKGVLGSRRILAQDPHSAPEESSHGPAPLVHAASASMRAAFRDAYRAFVSAFKAAAESLRANLPADFPEGSFPPGSPFIKPQSA